MSRLLLRVSLCACLVQLPAAFNTLAMRSSLQQGARSDSPRMASAAVTAKKAAIVDEVKGHMEGASMMFCVRSEGIKVNDMNMMRQKFPESVTVRCVKNTLVKRATEDFPNFQGGDDLLAYSNYWFFVPEDSMRETVDIWEDWIKETNKVRAPMQHLCFFYSLRGRGRGAVCPGSAHCLCLLPAAARPARPWCAHGTVAPRRCHASDVRGSQLLRSFATCFCAVAATHWGCPLRQLTRGRRASLCVARRAGGGERHHRWHVRWAGARPEGCRRDHEAAHQAGADAADRRAAQGNADQAGALPQRGRCDSRGSGDQAGVGAEAGPGRQGDGGQEGVECEDWLLRGVRPRVSRRGCVLRGLVVAGIVGRARRYDLRVCGAWVRG